jgi:hypothetical protein
MVRRVLDLETIRDNLRQHRYPTVRERPSACTIWRAQQDRADDNCL